MDAVTYPNEQVRAMLEAHFVPVLINRVESPEQASPFGPIWTPMLICQDGRGREFQREVGFLPPESFLPMLALGHARSLAGNNRLEEGVEALDRALDRHPEGTFTPQLIYWRGVLEFNLTHDPAKRAPWWRRLVEEYPTSTWAERAAYAFAQA